MANKEMYTIEIEQSDNVGDNESLLVIRDDSTNATYTVTWPQAITTQVWIEDVAVGYALEAKEVTKILLSKHSYDTYISQLPPAVTMVMPGTAEEAEEVLEQYNAKLNFIEGRATGYLSRVEWAYIKAIIENYKDFQPATWCEFFANVFEAGWDRYWVR